MLVSQQLPASEKPYTVYMPNAWNFVIDFEFFVRWGVPLIYLVSFPPLFMYMVRQRRKFYSVEDSESAKIKTN